MVWDLLNWQTIIIELGMGGVVAVGLFWLQHRMSKDLRDMTQRIDEFTQQKAKSERENKRVHCERIINNLKEILDAEQSFKDFLNASKIEGISKETLRSLHGMSLRSLVDKNMYAMNDAIEQVRFTLNNYSLINNFRDYIGAFYVIPKLILDHNQPTQEHQRLNLIHIIDEQSKKIQEFIKRFSKEMESSLAEKREEDQPVAREILNHGKYFNAPKL